MDSRNKPGPKPKGDRSQITLRVPAEHRELYALAARTAGLALNDYLVLVLAQAHRLPVPTTVAPPTGRGTEPEELPLTRAS